MRGNGLPFLDPLNGHQDLQILPLNKELLKTIVYADPHRLI